MKKINNEIIRYIIAGILTTLISILSYNICRNININYEISTIISWIIAVTFAYFINNLFVFQNKKNNLLDFFKFIFCRLLSLGIEFICMILMVEVLKIDDRIAKIIVQGIVFVLNYIFSKLLIFKK